MTDEFIQDANMQNDVSQSTNSVDLSNYLHKDEASKIVADQKKSAYEKGYNKALNEFQNKSFENQSQEFTNKNQSHIDENNIRKIIEDEFKRNQETQYEAYRKQQEQETAYKILNELSSKIADAENRYPDYKETVQKVDYINNLPDILELSNSVDNAGDVLYELAKNPFKIAGIRGLPQNLAALEIQKLSQSIKANQISAKKELPKDPLSRINSSNVGTTTGERKGVQYWKNDPRLRG